MKKTRKDIHPLLIRMNQIEYMERGKICRMKSRPHCNHQTWQNGRNIVRYVPVDQVKALQEAIDGYHQFMTLAEQYADEVIMRTRQHNNHVIMP